MKFLCKWLGHWFIRMDTGEGDERRCFFCMEAEKKSGR